MFDYFLHVMQKTHTKDIRRNIYRRKGFWKIKKKCPTISKNVEKKKFVLGTIFKKFP